MTVECLPSSKPIFLAASAVHPAIGISGGVQFSLPGENLKPGQFLKLVVICVSNHGVHPDRSE